MSKESIEVISIVVSVVAAGASVWAAFRTATAAKAASKSAELSSIQLKEQKEERERVERPRLVPLNHKLSTKIPSIFSDWETEEDKNAITMRLLDKFSRFTIPVINTGKSFAIDVKYAFNFKDGIHSFEDYSGGGLQAMLDKPELKQLESVRRFSFWATETNEADREEFETKLVDATGFVRSIPLVESGKIEQLEIPLYFIVLSNIFLKRYFSQSPNIKHPTLLLEIRYRDQYQTLHADDYLMRVGTKPIKFNNPQYTTGVEFKFVRSYEVNKKEKSPHQ